jgi:hypothetical protein
MGRDRGFPPVAWGWLSGAVALMLAAILTLATAGIQQPSLLFCQGLLSAGFPAPIVCDASGESPLSGVGHIGWEDMDSISIPGILVDLLCYSIPLWGIGLGVMWVVRRQRNGETASRN